MQRVAILHISQSMELSSKTQVGGAMTIVSGAMLCFLHLLRYG